MALFVKPTDNKIYNQCKNAYKRIHDMMTIYEFIPIVTSLSNALIILADYETNGKYRSAQITDCTHTAESIYVLFNPETVDNVTLSSIDEYNTSGIEFDNYNIFMITIQMSGEFHKFVCLQTEHRGYILTSYSGKYCLRSVMVDSIQNFVKTLLIGNIQAISLYNQIFETNLALSKHDVVIDIEYGKFNSVPISRLELWLLKYLCAHTYF